MSASFDFKHGVRGAALYVSGRGGFERERRCATLAYPHVRWPHCEGLQSPQHDRHASASACATLAVFSFVRAL